MGTGRRPDDRSIHLVVAGLVVSAGPLPAYLLTGKLLVVVALDADADHTRLVHDLLDHFAALADDFACGVGGKKKERKKERKRHVK